MGSENLSDSAIKDIVFLCDSRDSKALVSRLYHNGESTPVLAFSNIDIALLNGKFLHNPTNRLFENGIEIDGSSWPHHFIPFDHDSSDVEIAPHVARSLILCLLELTQCGFEQIFRQADPMYDLRGRPNRNTLDKKMEMLLVDLINSEFKRFVIQPTKALTVRRRTKRRWTASMLDELSDLSVFFVERKKQGLPFKPGQLRLFDPREGLPSVD